MTATVTVGPVVGALTDRTARVLAEVDDDVSVSVTLTDANGQVTGSGPLPLEAHRPQVFAFDGLAPGTAYTVGFVGAASPQPGSFRTLDSQPTVLRIGAVSCNKHGAAAAWQAVRAEVETLDLLVHAGDQIYPSQDLFDESVADWETMGSAAAPVIRERYREVYRSSWTRPATRDVLAHVPNLMIWDDHEVRNNWGTREEDRDSATPGHQVGLQAREVYRAYQGALAGPVGANGEHEGHLHVQGEMAVLFLDLHGARAFAPDPGFPMLGAAQRAAVEAAFAAGGALEQARALVVVSSLPPVLLSPWLLTGLGPLVESMKGQWAHARHRPEQRWLLDLLRSWQADGDRAVLLLCGDLHIGVQRTEIRHGGEVFEQMISSPISHGSDLLEYLLVTAALRAHRFEGQGLRVRHSGFLRGTHYGIATLTAQPGAPAAVSGELVPT